MESKKGSWVTISIRESVREFIKGEVEEKQKINHKYTIGDYITDLVCLKKSIDTKPANETDNPGKELNTPVDTDKGRERILETITPAEIGIILNNADLRNLIRKELKEREEYIKEKHSED